MQVRTRAFLDLHLAVILFGFTAILGKLITLSALVLIWWRVLITSVSLLFLVRRGGSLRLVRKPEWQAMIWIGVLMSLHWLCFYGAIKYANASVALITLATTSFLTSLVQPLILKVPFRWYEVGLGLLIVPGIWLVVDGVDLRYVDGVWVGLLSAVFAAIFSVWNKKIVSKVSTVHLTFVELSSAWVFLSLLLPVLWMQGSVTRFWPEGWDWLWLILLALLCTTLAQILSVRALRHISAFATNLTISLEPVYGILMAIVFLHEDRELNASFYLGMGIILLSVFAYPFLKGRFS